LSYDLDVKPDLIQCVMTGALTGNDLSRLAAEADAIEADFDRVPHRITDMTGVTVMEVGYPEVRAFALHRRTLQFPNTFKSAILVRSKVQFGIARMFQSLNDNSWITIQIFEDRTEAGAWLREAETTDSGQDAHPPNG
jgi:hypothetical protein